MAVKDLTTLKADLVAGITTNGNQEITGAILNTFLDDFLDSVPNLIDGLGLSSTKEYDGTITYNDEETVMFEGFIYQAIQNGITGAFDPTKWERVAGQNSSWQDPAIDILVAPPGGEAVGDRYIVDDAATGAWATHDGKLAEWRGAWRFTIPEDGWTIKVLDEDSSIYQQEGAHAGANGWVKKDFESGAASLYSGNGTILTGRVATITDTVEFSGGDFGIGISPTERFHVKGEGNTSATLAGLFQNSDGDQILGIRDDRAIVVSSGGAAGKILLDNSASGVQLEIGDAAGVKATLGIKLDSVGSGLTTFSTDAVAFAMNKSLRIDRVGNAALYVNNGTASLILSGRNDVSGAFGIVIDNDGNIGIGTALHGTNAASVLSMINDVAPTTDIANGIQLFSVDATVGDAEATLGLFTEQAVEAIGTFTPSHKLAIWHNGVEYHIQMDAV